MYHFFVTPAQIVDGYAVITGQDVNHIRNVLRMKQGEQIGVRDGISRNYICELETMEPDQIRARILSEEADSSELPAKLYLFQGLPKSDKMELIIQKAVELGAYQIIPVATRRAVVKLDKKKEESRVKRWNAIAESAAKQSGRMMIPEVTGVMSLKEAFHYASGFDRNLIPYELAEGMEETRRVLAQIRPGMQVGIFIGPEGGFDVEEVEQAVAEGIHPITLGRRILRTETAGMTMLSILMFQLEQQD
ncbi:MAG: 16S rRNA (uracil(1498)-N(3))-methyltransferase [Lachnospiraceae bacterium]|nr:16S rRNA (uracil(1498)-N(3))-methyltransferase [Lachnospiraceae bacterium]